MNINREEFRKAKLNLKEKAAETDIKNENEKKKKGERKGKGDKEKRSKFKESCCNRPKILKQEDLVGKLFNHKFKEEDEEVIYKRMVLWQGSGRNSNYFYIKYGEEENVCKFGLTVDWENGNVELASLSVDDFI